MRNFLIIILLLKCNSLCSQRVTIIDAETKFPISNCTIYGENNAKVVYTDKKGTADLSTFYENEIISFFHIAYVEVELLKRHLSEVSYTILLHKNAESLDEVVLSSSKQKEIKRRVPEHVEVNQIEKISRAASQTSADLLGTVPGVKVQKSQMGGGSPVLRGMEANKVLLVIDGVRMNNAIYRSGHLQNSITVSPSILERTEVLFGPSSVIYGSDALGGVIHYYTKSPELSAENKTDVNFMSRFSSANKEVTNQGDISFRFAKWASLTSFSYSKFDDLKMGKKRAHGYDEWGKVYEYSNNTDKFYNPNPVVNTDPNLQRNTSYSQRDLLQKFYVEMADDTNLTLNLQYSESSDIPRFDRLTERSDGELKFAEWYYGPQKRFMASSQLEINPDKAWIKSGVFTLAYQNIEESRIQRKFNSLDRSYRIEDVDVFSLNADFSVPLAKKSNRNLTYGFELAHNIVESNSFGKTIAVNGSEIIGFSGDFKVQSRYPDGGSTYTNTAIYTNYRQDISSKETLNTGIRYTRTWLNATWVDDTFFTLPESDVQLKNGAFTATVGYVYKPSKDWQLNSVVSSGFRSPNIDDVGKIREKNNKVSVPNIYLKPEFAYNAEMGVRKYLKDRQFDIGFVAYYTLLDNYISREPFSINSKATMEYDGEETETYANVNHKNAHIVGSTVSFEGKISKVFNIRGDFTLTEGRTHDTKLPLSSIPPFFGNIEWIYIKKRLETSLSYRFNGAKKQKDYNLVEGIDNIEQTPINISEGTYYGTPSWSSLNFYSKYQFTKSMAVQFRIDNIFDKHYKEFASALSAPGRNYSITLIIR